MIDIIGDVGIIYFGVVRYVKIRDVIILEGWCISGKRSRIFYDFNNNIYVIDVLYDGKGDDIVLWKYGVEDYYINFLVLRI